MPSITQTCKVSGEKFIITDQDQEFYKKIDVPPPTLCPEERRRRRLSIRNELSLHQRKCDRIGKSIISMYAPDIPYVIYDQDEWWKDDWSSLEYGQDFDFNRPFFEQFAELQAKVPRMSLAVIGNENSRYTNYSLRDKDCHLIFTADENEKCYYSRFFDRNYKCVDCDFTYDSRFCLGLLHAEKCEACFYSQKIKGSSGLHFCYNLQNCHDCIFCYNQQNKRHMIFNKELSKEKYEKMKTGLKLETYAGFKKAKEAFAEMMKKAPRKYLENKNCEDCEGDYLVDCKDVAECYDCYRLRDVKFATHLYDSHDCYDWDFVGYHSELCYEMSSSAYHMFNCKFTMNSWDVNKNLTYCDLCLGNEDLFGCIAMRKKKYCILNKQYTKEAFDKLRLTIIEHMRKTGEWGEFFPIQICPYGYNETVASEYFPLTKEEAVKRGYKWRDEDAGAVRRGAEVKLTESILETDEAVCEGILRCEKSGKLYKIIPQEFEFYKKFAVALPRLSSMERHKERMALRNPRKLWDRRCTKCGDEMKTSYAPGRPEPVYCEGCYLREVF